MHRGRKKEEYSVLECVDQKRECRGKNKRKKDFEFLIKT